MILKSKGNKYVVKAERNVHALKFQLVLHIELGFIMMILTFERNEAEGDEKIDILMEIRVRER